MNTIPVNRIVIYSLLLGFLPLFFVVFLFFSERSQLEDIQSSLEYIQNQALIKERKQALNVAVRQHFREADHFYIDKHIETLTFLEPEIEIVLAY